MSATTSPGRSDDEVPCPFCKYKGVLRSVEAHISAKTDEQHKGEVGRQYRGQLRALRDDPKTTTTEKGDNIAPGVAEENVTSDVAHGDKEKGTTETATYNHTTEVADEHVTDEVAAPDESDTSSGTAHAGVPAVVFVALLIALVLVIIYLTWPRRSEHERERA